MKRPADHVEAQQWLIKFGRQLATWEKNDRQAGMRTEYAQWMLAALSEHLLTGGDLVQALGLSRTDAGRPAVNQEWAFKAHPYVPKKGRANWFKIANAIGYKGTANNLRKIYKDHFDEMKFAIREVERGLQRP